MLNYVILTIHFSHIYSTWDFTHTCNPTNLPLTCEFLSLYGLQDLFVGHEQVVFHFISASSMGLAYAIHRNRVSTPHAHPWEPCTSMSMGTSHHHYLAPLAIFLCWVSFLLFFSSLGSLCVGRLGFICPRWVGTMNISPPSPHTTMSSDTTCWGDKHLGELS